MPERRLPVSSRRSSRPLGVAPRACAALLALLAGLAGCGDDEPSAPVAPASADIPFPVRLIPLNAVGSALPNLTDELSQLAAWYVLDGDAHALQPARDHAAVTRLEGQDQLTLAGPERALLRFVTPPVGESAELSARIAVESFALGEPAAELQYLVVQTLEEDESADDVLARGTARLPNGTFVPLPDLLLQKLAAAAESPSARWVLPPDKDGQAKAQFVVPPTNRAVLGVLALVALTDDLRAGRLVFGSRPKLDRVGDFTSDLSDGVAGAAEPIVAPIQASGMRRPSIVVPGGSSHVVEVSVPPGAERLSTGLCILPSAAKGASARWTIAVRGADGVETTLGGGTVTHDPDAPVRFVDEDLAWPKDLAGDLAIVFSATGGSPVVFGSPMLRARQRTTRPNVLFISIDTLRADHMGWLGYERPTTPNLDRIAAESVVFTDMTSVAPYTLPTHATMFTGQHPTRHGAIDPGLDRVDGSSSPFLPLILARADYSTAAFTGGGFVSPDYGFSTGFDSYSTVDPVINRDSDDAERRYAKGDIEHLDEIEEQADILSIVPWVEDHADESWFLFVHTYAAHKYEPPLSDFARFDTKPGTSLGTDVRELRKRLNPQLFRDNPPTPADAEHFKNLYDASVAFADREVGRFVDELDERGLLDDTIVVITSDHGEEFWEHGGLRHSVTLYQEMLAVPLLVRMPGRHAARVREPVSQVDVMPTVLGLLDLPTDGVVDGRSLAKVVNGGSARDIGRPLLVGHIDSSNSKRASLRIGPLKLIEGDTSDDVKFPAPRDVQLFDLAADPHELHDLSDERPKDVAALRTSLEGLLEAMSAGAARTGEVDVSQQILDQLTEMGYF